MDEADASTLTITAAESKENGLPGAAISLNLGDTFMRTQKFPGERIYATMSGPPGAPLGLSIRLASEAIGDEAAWRSYVEQHYQEPPAEFGTAAETELCDGRRPACTFTTGTAIARTHHLLVAVNVPDSETKRHCSLSASRREVRDAGTQRNRARRKICRSFANDCDRFRMIAHCLAV